jgi:hypothetical protein
VTPSAAGPLNAYDLALDPNYIWPRKDAPAKNSFADAEVRNQMSAKTKSYKTRFYSDSAKLEFLQLHQEKGRNRVEHLQRYNQSPGPKLA